MQEDRRIEFDIEFVKSGYRVVNRIGDDITIVNAVPDKDEITCLTNVLNPDKPSEQYVINFKGRFNVKAGRPHDWDLFCIPYFEAPLASGIKCEPTEELIPFDYEKAKAGAPFEFKDQSEYGKIIRVLDWGFVTHLNGQLHRNIVVVTKPHPDAINQHLYVITVGDSITTPFNANEVLKMSPPPKMYIALYSDTITDDEDPLIDEGTVETEYRISRRLYTEDEVKANPDSPIQTPKTSKKFSFRPQSKFLGYFPVTV